MVISTTTICEDGPSFRRFAELPCEVRLLIWEAALPGPRVVHLRSARLARYRCGRVRSDISMFPCAESPLFFDQIPSPYYSKIGPKIDLRGFKSDSPPPTLLFVCRESFKIASKRYQRAFGTKWSLPEVWFDFKQDTLYLDYNWYNVYDYTNERGFTSFCARDLVSRECEQIERLALDRRPYPFSYRYGDTTSTEGGLVVLLQLFCRVESVIFNMADLIRGPEDVIELCSSAPLSAEMLISERSIVGWRRHLPKHLYNALRYLVPDSTISWISRTHYLDHGKIDRYRKEFESPKSILRPLPTLQWQVIANPAMQELFPEVRVALERKLKTI